MQFNCYARPQNQVIDATAFVAFRADNKFVMGVLPSGVERLLLTFHRRPGSDQPEGQRVTLKAIEAELPGILRASRDVLVMEVRVLAVVGEGYQRMVRTAAGEFSLSRRQDVRPFKQACERNAQLRLADSPERYVARSAGIPAGARPAAWITQTTNYGAGAGICSI